MNFKLRGEKRLSTITISSRFKYGDPVVVYFGTAGIIQNCRVIKIHSTDSKVSYDVEVKWKHIESAENYSKGIDKERIITDRLYNLDSAVVLSPNDFEQPHPEDCCQRCGGKNVVWSAPNDLWNAIIGKPDGILCPPCFEERAEEKGISIIFNAKKN